MKDAKDRTQRRIVPAAHQPAIGIARGRGGRGVFALKDFREGEVVETCPTILLNDNEVVGRLRDYIYDSHRPDKCVLMFGYGSLYAHSAEPNLYHRQAGRLTVEFVALRDIASGEELTHNYGPDYWNGRGKRPR